MPAPGSQHPALVPTTSPQVFFDKEGNIVIPALNRAYRATLSREDDFYDSVQVPSGTLAAGTKAKFFDLTTNKNEQHLNLSQTGRIAAGVEMTVTRIGTHIRLYQGNTRATFDDIARLSENGVFECRINKRLVSQGPILTRPSGYGLAGSSVQSNANAISIGVPSAMAAPSLLVPQNLRGQNDVTAECRWDNATWITGYAVPVLDAQTVLTCFLHGIIEEGVAGN